MGPKKNDHGLTYRQQLFADYYLTYGNAVIAADKAGLEKSYAQGCMKQPRVKEYLAIRRKEIHDKSMADADEVIKFLTDVMRGFYIQKDGKLSKDAEIRLEGARLLSARLGLGSNFAALMYKIKKEL